MLNFIQLYKFLTEKKCDTLSYTRESDGVDYLAVYNDYADDYYIELRESANSISPDFKDKFDESIENADFVYNEDEAEGFKNPSHGWIPNIIIFPNYKYDINLIDDFYNNPEKYATVNDEYKKDQ